MRSLLVADERVQRDLVGLFREQRTALVAAVSAISGDVDAATDAIDEAFVRAFMRRERVEMMVSPAGCVLTVALNALRRTKSREVRRRQAEAFAAPSEWIDPADVRHEAWLAVAGLPPREREAVALRYLADLTEPQVAEVMKVAVGTVSATLTSARRRLATALRTSEEGE